MRRAYSKSWESTSMEVIFTYTLDSFIWLLNVVWATVNYHNFSWKLSYKRIHYFVFSSSSLFVCSYSDVLLHVHSPVPDSMLLKPLCQSNKLHVPAKTYVVTGFPFAIVSEQLKLVLQLVYELISNFNQKKSFLSGSSSRFTANSFPILSSRIYWPVLFWNVPFCGQKIQGNTAFVNIF